MRSVTFLAVALAALAAVPAAARAGDAVTAGPVTAGDGHVRVSLVTDVATARAGEPFVVGVRLELDPGWHAYWINPGQSGMATEIAWTGDGVTVTPRVFPAPERITTPDGYIVTYGWHGDVVLAADAVTTAGGTVRAVADLLVCDEECVPVHVELARSITTGDGAPGDAGARAAIAASAARIPRAPADVGASVGVQVAPAPVPASSTFTATITARGDGLALPAGGPAHAFFPERVATVTWEPAHRAADGGAAGVVVAGATSPDAPPPASRLAGVLALDRHGEPVWLAVDPPLPRAPAAEAASAAPEAAPAAEAASAAPEAAPAATEAAPPPLGLAEALLLALLGGLVLNLMPCVLPVLAIKVGGLVRLAGERTADRALHAGAYAGGITASMLVLAGVVLALRAAGTQVGWGFQFQEPGFIAAVGALLAVLAVNAFGGLELAVGADALGRAVDRRHGLARSAGEGVLAVILATPCSAPALGTAIGFALASPAHVVVLTFVALGVGLAAPVVLVAVVPGARRVLPRPGPWMSRLKQAVGLTLIAAAIWLGWILGRGFGVDAMGQVLAFWLAVAVAAWIVGAARDARPRARIAAAVAAIGLAIGTGALTLRFDLDAARAARAARLGAGWEPWSDAAVAAHLADGRAVFVDFTADWCLTCKVNERTSIEIPEVRELAAARGIAMLKADWTLEDEAIRAALARHGRAGVPMYLVYSPSRPDRPVVLPELLTPDTVLEALEAAAP